MFYLTQDFHNSDIFEMLGDFFGSLPELLMWLLESALPSLVWIIPTILYPVFRDNTSLDPSRIAISKNSRSIRRTVL